MLGVVALVSEQLVDALVRRRLDEGGLELRRIDARTQAHVRAEQKVRRQIADDRQLWIRREFVTSAEPPNEVATDVTTLEPGRVDRSATRFSEQSDRAGYQRNRSQQGRERPL